MTFIANRGFGSDSGLPVKISYKKNYIIIIIVMFLFQEYNGIG